MSNKSVCSKPLAAYYIPRYRKLNFPDYSPDVSFRYVTESDFLDFKNFCLRPTETCSVSNTLIPFRKPFPAAFLKNISALEREKDLLQARRRYE